jgi:hypothetical protein
MTSKSVGIFFNTATFGDPSTGFGMGWLSDNTFHKQSFAKLIAS